MSVFQTVARQVLNPQQAGPQGPRRLDMVVLTSKLVDTLEGRPLGHGQRVALLSIWLGQTLGLPTSDLETLALAGLLHDVGLLTQAPLMARYAEGKRLSVQALLYTHSLDPELWGAVCRHLKRENAIPGKLPAIHSEAHFLGEQPGLQLSETLQAHSALKTLLGAHPMTGQALLRALLPKRSDTLETIIGQHHEAWDGSGYPHQLRYRQSSRLARIVHFADQCECLITLIRGLGPRLSSLHALSEANWLNKIDPELNAALRTLALSEEKYSTPLSRLASKEGLSVIEATCSAGLLEALSAEELLNSCQQLGNLCDGLLGPGAEGHSERSAQLLAQLGQSLEFEEEATGQLVLAGYLQGLGRAAVSTEILHWPDTPGAGQWRQLYTMPSQGERVIQGAQGLDGVAQWVGEQYERLNGSGYEYRKKSSEISVGGRLLGLVNVFVALTSQRVYRPHVYDPADALALMQQQGNRHFDVRLLAPLADLVKTNEPSLKNALEKPIVARRPKAEVQLPLVAH